MGEVLRASKEFSMRIAPDGTVTMPGESFDHMRAQTHIAGLKEAAELVRANSAWMGNAQFVLDAITARIADLEKGK